MDFALKSKATDWFKMRETQFKDAEPEVSEEPDDPSVPAVNLDEQTKLDRVLKDIDTKRPSDKI